MKHSKDFKETILTMCDSFIDTLQNLEMERQHHKKLSKEYSNINKKIARNKEDFIDSIISVYDIEN